jgi:hypothetical protein
MTNQGNLTLQFINMAAKPNNITSPTTCPPFWKNIPPSAGSNAKARGKDCQLLPSPSPPPALPSCSVTLGRNKSSVLLRSRLRVSLSEEKSENPEDRRRIPGFGVDGALSSLMVAKRLERGRRNCADSWSVRIRRWAIGGEVARVAVSSAMVG